MKRNQNVNLLIYGSPGSGKNHLANILFGDDYVDIDSAGHWTEDKWSIDLSKVPKGAHHYVGNPDDLKVFVSDYNIRVLFIPWPPYELWLKAMKERLKTSKHPDKYREKSHWSKSQFENEMRKFLNNSKSLGNRVAIYVVYTTYDKTKGKLER